MRSIPEDHLHRSHCAHRYQDRPDTDFEIGRYYGTIFPRIDHYIHLCTDSMSFALQTWRAPSKNSQDSRGDQAYFHVDKLPGTTRGTLLSGEKN